MPKSPATDPATFDVRTLIAAASTVTKTVEVCMQPQLLGEIEELTARLERADAAAALRPLAPTERPALEEQRDALRAQMFDSIHIWRVRGLRNGEAEKIRARLGTDGDEKITDDLTRADYAIWAAQIVSVDGHDTTVTGDDLIALHEALGNYFTRTLVVTCNTAHYALDVTVPFSSTSSEPSQT